MSESKYTFFYDANIEKLLDETLASIVAEISNSPCAKYLDFLTLGGGYGRGEGGIRFDAEGQSRLYNDLDFFVISKTDDAAGKAELSDFFKELGEALTKKLGIDADFSAPYTASYIMRRADMLMWREMMSGCKVVWGGAERYSDIFKAPQRPIPPEEIAKLLANRLSGLFFAMRRMDEKAVLSPEDCDFAARNINKPLLACADAVLASRNEYVFKSLARLAKLRAMKLDGFTQEEELKRAYEKAINFKMRPSVPSDKAVLQKSARDAALLAMGVCAYLKPYLDKSDGLNILKRMKNLFKNLKLRKELKTLGSQGGLFKNPFLTLLEILESFLYVNKPSYEKTEAYIKIWRNIN